MHVRKGSNIFGLTVIILEFEKKKKLKKKSTFSITCSNISETTSLREPLFSAVGPPVDLGGCGPVEISVCNDLASTLTALFQNNQMGESE